MPPVPTFQFSKQLSGANTETQGSVRDGWKGRGHSGFGTRLSTPVLEARTPELKKANPRTWRN